MALTETSPSRPSRADRHLRGRTQPPIVLPGTSRPARPEPQVPPGGTGTAEVGVYAGTVLAVHRLRRLPRPAAGGCAQRHPTGAAGTTVQRHHTAAESPCSTLSSSTAAPTPTSSANCCVSGCSHPISLLVQLGVVAVTGLLNQRLPRGGRSRASRAERDRCARYGSRARGTQQGPDRSSRSGPCPVLSRPAAAVRQLCAVSSPVCPAPSAALAFSRILRTSSAF